MEKCYLVFLMNEEIEDHSGFFGAFTTRDKANEAIEQFEDQIDFTLTEYEDYEINEVKFDYSDYLINKPPVHE